MTTNRDLNGATRCPHCSATNRETVITAMFDPENVKRILKMFETFNEFKTAFQDILAHQVEDDGDGHIADSEPDRLAKPVLEENQWKPTMTHQERKKTIKSKGLTHKKLARKINYTRPRISQVLKEPKDTCYRIQAAIADALGVDYQEFWGQESARNN